jgi:enamine deaminase RidA (YjgF/YER057c/UK114 family)
MLAMTISRHNPEAAPPVAKYSQVVRVDLGEAALLFLSGIVGVDAGGTLVGADLIAQADQVYANLEAVLASQGAGMEHVVKVTSFFREGVDRTPLLGRQRFADDALPAATLVFVSSLADPAYLLEVEAVAVIPRQS